MADSIPPDHLVSMGLFASLIPFSIDLAYGRADHPRNIFQTALYAPDAPLLLHKDMAKIVINVARDIFDRYGWTLVLHDGLRVYEAQEAMQHTDIVKVNPHWMEAPRMVSPPGIGAHPRGMAIDVSVKDIDMGTAFDDMSQASARDYTHLPETVLQNRAQLEDSFRRQADKLGLPILPLPNEWWDFRFPADYSKQFAPLYDADLPAFLRMTSPQDRTIPPEWQTRFDKTRRDVLNSLI